MLYRRNQRWSETCLKDKHGMGWGADLLRIHYLFLLDFNAVSRAQAIKLSKVASISNAFVRRETSFTGTRQSLLSYMGAYKEDYGVQLVDVRIIVIVGVMESSIFLASNFNMTYLHYIRIYKMMIKLEGLFRLPMDLGKNAAAAQTLHITHSHGPNLYISIEDDKLLMIQAAETLVKDNHKPVLLKRMPLQTCGSPRRWTSRSPPVTRQRTTFEVCTISCMQFFSWITNFPLLLVVFH